MSTRFNFLIFLLILGLNVGFTFRLIDGPVYLKTCPANGDSHFEELLPNEQQKHFYNVHNIPNNHQPDTIPKEKFTNNWLMRIIKIRTIPEKPKSEDSSSGQDNRINGLMQKIFRILHLRPKSDNENDNNDRKMFLILRKDPQAIDHHIVKKDPLPYSFM